MDLEQQSRNNSISFHGSYSQFWGLALYNILLTIITLGIYYPWAKCAIRKFLWQETEVGGSRLEWHGTGLEMFRGFIKAYAIVGSLLLIINFGPYFLPPELVVGVIIIAYLGILTLIPLAIHGMARYRFSRTSLRGIYFGYRGRIGEFYGKTIRDFLFTILTLGIYGFWLQTNIRRYVMRHARFGDVEADYDGQGGELLGLSLVQGILTAITFYIYLPWAIIEILKFHIHNTSLIQKGKRHYFQTNATGGAYFIVMIKAFFITVFSLGIAAPVAQLMIHKYIVESLSIEGDFNFDNIEQTEGEYRDATGDDMGDILDIDL